MSAPAAYTPPVDQPPPLPAGSPYGGFWVRFAAHIVDSFIVGILTIILVIVWMIAVGVESGLASQDLMTLVILALTQVYHAYFVSSAKMATPGKRLCGLYVTDTDGHRLSFIHALGRNVAALLSYLTLYIGFIMAAFTERKQALHDKLAGTLVHRQPGGSAVIAIVIVVILFVGIAVMGIVAAVAIPAYQDYVVRAKMAGVISAATTAQAPITVYADQKGAWPTTWEQVESVGGINPMQRIPEESRSIVEEMRLDKDGVVVTTVKLPNGEGQFLLTPRKTGNQVEWTCSSSDRIRKYVPATCRNP